MNSDEQGQQLKKHVCGSCGSEEVESHELRSVNRGNGEGGVVLIGGVPVHSRVCLTCGWVGDFHVTPRAAEVLREAREERIAKQNKKEEHHDEDHHHHNIFVNFLHKLEGK